MKSANAFMGGYGTCFAAAVDGKTHCCDEVHNSERFRSRSYGALGQVALPRPFFSRFRQSDGIALNVRWPSPATARWMQGPQETESIEIHLRTNAVR